ncbi:MAG: MBL fold metallo-hydrolase, partial [Alcaligenaceae bacterium]|nr:MBL fold metallo-hydrolase [Alcaligenaceae bacterium]
AAWRYALLDIRSLSIWAVVLSLFAIFNLFIAKFSRWTVFSLLWLLPIFMGVSAKQQLKDGEWQLTALDVGQGSAILIKTRDHNLLFDVGPRVSYDNEASNKVIIPVLRALGIAYLDYVVVSHSDLDHVGGFSELISQIPVGQVVSSFRLDSWLSKEESIFAKDYTPLTPKLKAEACMAGVQFELDGVSFSFIWPHAEDILPLAAKSKNEESCVLLVQGRHHQLLLTGDIDQSVENQLLRSMSLPKVDVVVVAHHGSKTSSSKAFINQVEAKIAIAQAGHYNRYRHPDIEVSERWRAAGSSFYDTVSDGAVSVHSTAFGLLQRSEKAQKKRYWH